MLNNKQTTIRCLGGNTVISDFISEILNNFVLMLENRRKIEKLYFLLSRTRVAFSENMTFMIFGYESFALLSQDSKLVGSNWVLLVCDNYTLVNQ